MQRGIDSYFRRKAAPQSQPLTSVKRKALTISSDEDCSPKKRQAVTTIKKPKVSKEPTCSMLQDKHNLSQKNCKLVDVASMFAGPATREEKKTFNVNHSFDIDDVGCRRLREPIENSSPKKIKQIKEERKSDLKDEMIDILAANQKTLQSADCKAIKEENSLPFEEANEPKGKKLSDLETSILSDEERFERKRVSAMLYQKFKNRQSVINPGSKEVPKGKPNCLAGLSFLITGVLESLEKDEAYSIIKELGGKVLTTVGKRLNFLIVGEEAGPKKLADAESIGTNILSVDGLFNLIKERSNEKIKIEPGKNVSDNKLPKNKKTSTKTMEFTTTKVKNEICKTNKVELEEEEKEVKQEVASTTFDGNNIAWVEKYKPTSVKQIIGQQGPASNCAKLMNWLAKWHTNQSNTKKLMKPNPWAKSDDGSYFKATLLSGPPGVGKTTTANLVCKELGFDIIEFNASDTRSKRLLQEEVSELLSNKSLYGYFNGATQVVSKKHILIMDEVDGMAGNEDRGGIQELITLIKDSHVPIICMCNDRNHPKMRSLVNYCYDLRFNKPRLEQIKGFIRSICFKEKIKLSNEKIEEIILATNNDIRQSVNHLCLLSVGKEIELKSNNVKTAQKDLKMGPWEVIRKVFSVDDHKTMSLADKSDLFFHDYSMAPLFVQQNYIIVSPNGPKSEVTKKIALTADALSLGDMVDRRIRSTAAWVLLPVQAMFSSVLPGEYMEGHFTGQINFPGWLGKYSRASKQSRLAQEIHDHTRLRTSGSRLSIRMDYAPFILSSIARPLKENGLNGIEESLNVLKEYRLLREDIDSLIDLTSWPGKKSQMETVDGRVKAALTRSYNKEVLPYSYSAVTAEKKKKTGNLESEDIIEMMDNEEETAVIDSEEEIDNTLENDNLIKAPKKTLSTMSSKASTSKAAAAKKAGSSAKKATANSKK